MQAHQWLQQRSRELQRKRDQAHLSEVQVERGFQHRVNRGKHGLNCVVEKVTKTDRQQDIKQGFVCPRLDCGSLNQRSVCFASHFKSASGKKSPIWIQSFCSISY